MNIEPIWCLIGAALAALLLALAALTARPPQLRQIQPGRVVRGCIASGLLLVALVLLVVIIIVRAP